MEMQAVNPVALWPTAVLVTTAAITDLRSRRIPNLLVLPALFLGTVSWTVAHGWSGLWQSLLGMLFATAVLGVFCFLGGMGMGDLKLFAAVGAWIGPSQLQIALVMTGLFGGIIGVVWAAAGGFLREALIAVGCLILGKRRVPALGNPAARTMPYAPAIALGTMVSFLGRHV